MNKFKKTALVILTAAGLACIGGAAGCKKTPKYYKLSFEGVGIDYILQDNLAEFESGGTVKSGVEVRFTLSRGANTVGEPEIVKNGEVLTPDADGVYSFVMSEETVISVNGVKRLYTLDLSRFTSVLGTDGYVSEEQRIHYTDENGNRLDDQVQVTEGSDFKFKLYVSPYYVPEYSVSNNYEVLEADANGVYTIENVSANSTVSVAGLAQEGSFVTSGGNYGDYGTGTEEDPFQISKPIDLYYMAVLVNSEFYAGTYNGLHYKLMNDIDMQGEQLYVIGDASLSSAVFCGSFDGNGHTIKNFYITDEVIDQETYQQAYLPYVGLFGQAVATESSPVVIKDLTLEDYEVTVHPARAQSYSFAGSLVGYGVGTQITNCKATGSVSAYGDDNMMIYLGGLIGYMQSAYGRSSGAVITHDAYVSSCSTNIGIQGLGSPHSVGGVAGYLDSADENAISYVINSYSTGGISGGMHSGGIVGTLSRFSSVINCYSTSSVAAINEVNSAMAGADYQGAYAGGIVGDADEDTVVAGCFSSNQTLSASSAFGRQHEKTGKYVANVQSAGSVSVESAANVSLNAADAAMASQLTFTNLGWSDKYWDFSSALPTLKNAQPSRTVGVRIKASASDSGTLYERTSTVLQPIYQWYKDSEADASKGLPEYLEGNGGRSYGYYFDAGLTQKVPYGYVPAADETVLYVGYADYSEVAGTYYLQDATYSKDAYITLSADGSAFLRNGGLHFTSTYSYDGDKIIIYNTVFDSLAYAIDEVSGDYVTYVGTKTDDGFAIRGIVTLTETDTSGNTTSSTADLAFNAVKASELFKYGKYTSGSATYTFYKNGHGVAELTDQTIAFTFEVADDEVELTASTGAIWFGDLSGGLITTINNVSVSLTDNFAGTWRTDANSVVAFSFDGKGMVSYSSSRTSLTTTDYTVTGETATFSVNSTDYTAHFDADGYLVINGVKYFEDDGFAGVWYMPAQTNQSERIEIELGGVGLNGYGEATITYSGSETASLSAEYAVFEGGVARLYVDDALYGELTLNRDGVRAGGIFYSLHNEAYYQSTTFYLYDSFKGVWVSSSNDIKSVNFNGKSSDGTGEATVEFVNGSIRRGSYSLTSSDSGKLTVNGVDYTLGFDVVNNKVSFVSTSVDDLLARRDGWYLVTLYEGGVSYAFDGNGYTLNGGKVTVTDGEDVSYLTYTAEGDTVMLDGTALTPTANGFTWNSKTLTFGTGFANTWLIAGVQKRLTVGEVGGDFTAQVSYEGVDGTYAFTYDPAAKTLTHIQTVDGEMVVTVLKISDDDEMSVMHGNASYNAITYEHRDAYMGEYTATNGTKWTFDGLGNCQYGYGSAYYTENGVTVKYRYRTNDATGTPYIYSDGGKVFVAATDGQYTAEGSGQGYKVVVVDAMYGKTAVNESQTLKYFFDGAGALWCDSGSGYQKQYVYELVAGEDNKVVLKTDGATYNATLVKEGKLTIIEIVEAE